MNTSQFYCLECGSEIPKELFNKEKKGICPICKKNVYFIKSNPEDIDAETKWRIEHQRKENEIVKKGWDEKEIENIEQDLDFDIISLLQKSSLLVDTIKEVQDGEGIAGEEDTILAGIIVANTRLVIDAIAESKNLFYSDTTGIGKDRVAKATNKVVVPEEDNLHVTKMTPEAFTYWHANEAKWNWDSKVIHFEDITSQILNSSTFKVMASGESKSAVVKDQRTIEIEINGKPVMILTSHHATPNDENLRRFPIGGLDDSIEQTRRIKDKISMRYSMRKKVEPNLNLRRALHSLKPYKVVIPYAELIQHFFPEDFIMRTHYNRFLDYICSSAVFHQYQREQTDEGHLIAAADDYMIARLIIFYTTSNPKMSPISKENRIILTILREKVAPMTIKEIMLDNRCNKSKDWLYKNLPKLVETGLVEKNVREQQSGAIERNVITFQYAKELNANVIPSWNTLMNRISEILDCVPSDLNIQEELFLNWLKNNEIIIAVDDEGRFYLVLFEKIIPVYKEDLVVFEDLLAFFKERNNKLYERYSNVGKIEGSSLGISSLIEPYGDEEIGKSEGNINIEW